MSVVILGGNERMVRNPDLLVLFTSSMAALRRILAENVA